MITYPEAIDIIKTAADFVDLKEEVVSLAEALGRVCANPILAPIDVQPFDNSAMDGYAVSLVDCDDKPVALEVVETIAAGDVPACQEHRAGTCAAIMTGAMIPAWAEAVVPIEQVVHQSEGQIQLTQCPKKGDHIRRRGQDFKAGTQVILKGECLTPGRIMSLATLGYENVPVVRRVKVCFVATGRELQLAGTVPLEPGKIFNSNTPYALSEFERMGAVCVSSQVVSDDADNLADKILKSFEKGSALIISSGAVSAGQFDFVRKTLEDMGAEILFHKVSIKPGKPVLFACFPNGVHYFGLPGNPAATAAGLRFFVQPFLERCQGMAAQDKSYAVLERSFEKKNNLRLFLKASVRSAPDGRQVVSLLDGQESFMISPFLQMNAWAVFPEEAGTYAAGTPVEVYPLQR